MSSCRWCLCCLPLHALQLALVACFAAAADVLAVSSALCLIVWQLRNPLFEQLWIATQLVGSCYPNMCELLVAALHRMAVALQLPPERRPAEYSQFGWDHVGSVACVLSGTDMTAVLAEHMQPPAAATSSSGAVSSNDQRLLRTAGLLVEHAPLDPWLAGATFMSSIMRLLGSVCERVNRAVHCFRECNRDLQQPHQAQQLEQLSHMEQQLLQALPRLPQMVQHLAADEELRFGADSAVALCRGWEQAAALLQQLADLSIAGEPSGRSAVIDTVSDLAAWGGAGSAAVRSVSLFAAVVRQHHAHSYLQIGIRSLVFRLVSFVAVLEAAVASCARRGFGASTGSPPAESIVAEAAAALWGMHTAACRAAHSQAAGDHLLVLIPDPALRYANTTMLASWQLHQRMQPGATEPARCGAQLHARSLLP